MKSFTEILDEIKKRTGWEETPGGALRQRVWAACTKYKIERLVMPVKGSGSKSRDSYVDDSDVEKIIKFVLESGEPHAREKAGKNPPVEPKVAEPPPSPVLPLRMPPVFDPQAEFSQTVRKLIHLCEKLDIDCVTIQNGEAEILRTVRVSKQEKIKG